MTQFLRKLNAALAEWLVRRRVALFVIGLALTAAAFPLSRQLKYNRSLEGFFPVDDARLQLYQQDQAWFGGEGTLIIAYADTQLWTPAGMERQLQLAHALKKIAGVTSAVCLADQPLPKQPLLTIADAVKGNAIVSEEIRKQVQQSTLYRRVFVADDAQTTAILVQLQPRFATAQEQADCLEAVRNIVRSQLQPFVVVGVVTSPAVAGTPLMIHDVYEYTESDGRRLEAVSILLMGAVIALSLRRIRWVVLPLLIIYASLYWSEGLWAIFKGEMTMVGSAISSLVAVIGVSTVVHYGVHYQESRWQHDPVTSLRLSFEHINPSIFWVLATTAGGFAALLVCDLKPVLDFAWLMLIASVLIGVATLIFLPLGVIGFRHQLPPEPPAKGFMENSLVGSFHWIVARPWRTGLGIIVPFSLMGVGMWWLEPQTDFTENFRTNTEIFRAYDFIETQLGGAGQLDLVFDAPDLEKLPKKELDDFLRRLRALRDQLSLLTGVTKVLGLVDFLDFFDANPFGGNLSMATRLELLDGRVDDAVKEIGFAVRLLPAAQIEKFRKQPRVAPLFWNRTAGKMRISLQVRERLESRAKTELIEVVGQKGNDLLGADRHPQTTGIYVMLAHLIESILNDQNKTFLLSLLCQIGMAMVAFRSFWLALITMVPTVLPVVAVVGTMGWLGLPVNIATAMLASVAMGMTIDSSILYIYRFQQELRHGAEFSTALARTHATAGAGVVVSNFAIVLGFGALILSHFIPLVHFGIFMGLALFGGMAGNLVLLPLMLHWVPGLKKQPMKVAEK